MIQLNFYSGIPQGFYTGPMYQRDALAYWEYKIGNAFSGFTKFKATGNWEGMVEDSVVYVVVFEELAYPTWEYMAKQAKLSLAEALGQDEVLVTWIQIGGLL